MLHRNSALSVDAMNRWELERWNPLNGSTLLTACNTLTDGGTWSLGSLAGSANGTNGYAVTSAASTSNKIPGNVVKIRANKGYDLYGRFVHTGFVNPTGRMQFLITNEGRDATDTGNGIQTITIRVTSETGAHAASAYTNCFYTYVTVPIGTWLVTVDGMADPQISALASATPTADNINCGWFAKGSPSWDTTMTVVDFYWGGDGNTTPGINVAEVRYGGTAKAIIAVGADDNRRRWFTHGIPILENYGIMSMVYHITNTLDTEGAIGGSTDYATEAQMVSAYARGAILIGGHTGNHGIGSDLGGGTSSSFLTTTSHIARIEPEYLISYNKCIEMGWTDWNCHQFVASPFGNKRRLAVSAAHETAFRNIGITDCRLANQTPVTGVADDFSRPCLYVDDGTAINARGMSLRKLNKLVNAGAVIEELWHNAIADGGSPTASLDAFDATVEAHAQALAEYQEAGKAIVAPYPMIKHYLGSKKIHSR